MLTFAAYVGTDKDKVLFVTGNLKTIALLRVTCTPLQRVVVRSAKLERPAVPSYCY